MSGFTTINSFSNNEISYSLRKTDLSSSYIDIDVLSTSLKWNNFDIAFEYRTNSEEDWKNDSVISFTTANTINYNKVYGLQASSLGSSNTIRWEYVKNNVVYGSSIQIRIKILPRIRNFSYVINNSIVSENYGTSNASLTGYSTTNKIINVNNYGQYICLTSDSVKILNDINDTIPVYTYSTLINPSHAIQIDNGHYIICDSGGNRVIEINSTMTTLLYQYFILNPIFADYDNVNSVCLVTSSSLNAVYEIDLIGSVINWDTTITTLSLNNPRSATYMLGNSDSIVISDYGNSRVVDINKVSYDLVEYTNYKVNDSDVHFNFHNPYRSYKMDDSKFIIIEEDGKVVDFNYAPELNSSSSSSSSSSTEIMSSSSSSSSTS